jgi:hypothetical protein
MFKRTFNLLFSLANLASVTIAEIDRDHSVLGIAIGDT